jgi:hypothetical protein
MFDFTAGALMRLLEHPFADIVAERVLEWLGP